MPSIRRAGAGGIPSDLPTWVLEAFASMAALLFQRAYLNKHSTDWTEWKQFTKMDWQLDNYSNQKESGNRIIETFANPPVLAPCNDSAVAS